MIDVDQYTDAAMTCPMYYHADFYPELLACARCACRAEASRVVAGEGPLDAEFMVLGQNPGDEEDTEGRPFIGRGGKEFADWLTVLGLARERILVTNAVKCHTTRNRVPKTAEITTCTHAWLTQELHAFPKLQVIITLGKPATAVVLGNKTKVPLLEPFWAKVQFAGRVFHCVPLPHPAYILRAQTKRPELVTRVLPAIVEYLTREVPEAYARARP